MKLYIADTHFGHSAILGFDHRPFKDCDEMWSIMVSLWNMRVRQDDDVYIVGDFCSPAGREPKFYLRKLAGKKHLVVGNHDDKLIRDSSATSLFKSISTIDEIYDETPDGTHEKIVLCHYPMCDWPGKKTGAYHVFGHIHNAMETDAWPVYQRNDRMLNAFCGINGWTPASLKEMIENNRKFKNGNSGIQPRMLT